MKKLVVFAFTLLLFYEGYGQTNTFPTSGNVGIGTTSPITNLQIDPDGSGGGILIGNSNTGSGGYTSLFMNISSYKSGSGAIQCISSAGSSYGNLLLNPVGGNVGIGTTSPGDVLSVAGNSSAMQFVSYNISSPTILAARTSQRISLNVDNGATEAVSIVPGGNVGIGTSDPTDKLDIFAPDNGLRILSNSSSSYSFLQLGRTSSDASIGVTGTSGEWAVGASSGDFVLRTESIGNKIFLNNGNVSTGLVVDNNNILIGKTSQTNTSYKLDVNGNIRANQITVNATGADYVFDPNYRLRSLDSLGDYVKLHHHLPGIPTAGDMQREGMNIGATQTMLLKKIEELTLYLIDVNERVQELEGKATQLNGSGTSLTGTNSSLTFGTDLSGGSYDGSSAVTVNNTSTLQSVTNRGNVTTSSIGIGSSPNTWSGPVSNAIEFGGVDGITANTSTTQVALFSNLHYNNGWLQSGNATFTPFLLNIGYGIGLQFYKGSLPGPNSSVSLTNIFSIDASGNITGTGAITMSGGAIFKGDFLHVGDAATGNVGFEFGSLTTSEESFLDFHSSGTGSDYDARIDAVGGNATPGQGTLQFIAGGFSFNNAMTATKFITSGGTSSQFLKGDGSLDGTAYLPVSGGTINGNLGIGTSNPQSKLTVNGTITATEVKVTQTGWSDFVFDSAYRLPQLSNITNYIKANHHLPDIPSAKEIENKGLNIGAMEKKQMQKIEELTLYQIAADKRINELEDRDAKLQKEIAELKEDMKQLKNKSR